MKVKPPLVSLPKLEEEIVSHYPSPNRKIEQDKLSKKHDTHTASVDNGNTEHIIGEVDDLKHAIAVRK